MSTERNLDPEVKAAFGENAVRLTLLAYADFPSGPVRIWTGAGMLYVDGFEWTGVGGLLSVEDVTESTDTAQNGMAVKLSGIPSEIFSSVTLGNYQNRRAEISLLVFDEDFQAVGSPVPLFRGLMDSDQVKDSGSEVSVTINIESAMSDQLRPRVYRYTHEDQQTLHPDAGDKGLEFVAALQNLNLKWGIQ